MIIFAVVNVFLMENEKKDFLRQVCKNNQKMITFADASLIVIQWKSTINH